MRKRPRNCGVCGRRGTAKRPISFRGKCSRCGEEAVTEAIVQMAEGEGPVFERWTANRTDALRRELEQLDSAGRR